MAVSLKSSREVDLMRRAGTVVAEVLDLLRREVRPGVTTAHLDRIAHDLIVERGGHPSFLGYDGFPASICTSVNDEIVHGIPGDDRLEEGDILSIDVGVEIDGYNADAALTLPVGEVSEDARALIDAAEGAFWAGLAQAREGARIGDISAAIQRYAEEQGYQLVEGLTGHGVGRELHEEPQVPNIGQPDTGMKLRAGMTLAIEPMLTTGSGDIDELDDEWTIVTYDGEPASHYEHTVLITTGEPVVLTAPEGTMV